MADLMSDRDKAQLAGIDLSLIDESLGFSYEQRAVRHQEALNLALEIEKAGKRLESDQSAFRAPLRR